MDSTISDNVSKSRYELVEDGHVAYAEYHRDGKILSIDYVFAPAELRGTGTAGRLMQGVMEDVKKHGLKATPVCGYAASWLRRHPEFSDLTL